MGDAEDSGERRRERRHPTEIEVDCTCESTFLFAYITDISSMGIFLRADRLFEIGTMLELRFSAPAAVANAMEDDDPTPLQLRGEVVWNTEGSTHGGNSGMGVRFVDLKPRQRSRIMELVRAIAYLDDAN